MIYPWSFQLHEPIKTPLAEKKKKEQKMPVFLFSGDHDWPDAHWFRNYFELMSITVGSVSNVPK